ncbi:hypothetical protein [Achromobacter aegrifaciens]|uniref:hypothetical protein n=1 Tax=Achromobacter aegrifaciens TaxID=1287736 RepID=UPI00158415A9|nr:hypothetical protein [Achromobacter aegrifaciens]
MAAKLHERAGFNYKGKRYFHRRWAWIWHFRPVTCELFVEYHRPGGLKMRKADIELFLSQNGQAITYYEENLSRQGDVRVAKQALAFARAQYERRQQPNCDPGGSTNNSGKVARILDANSKLVPDAEARLARAIATADILATGNQRKT